jgi:hypothetical protein
VKTAELDGLARFHVDPAPELRRCSSSLSTA